MTRRILPARFGIETRSPALAGLPRVPVYDPPLGVAASAQPSLPASGVTSGIEARTVRVVWPTTATGAVNPGEEIIVYSFTRQWRAVDVYIQDTNAFSLGLVLSIRIYAISAESAPILVASGRVGNVIAAASTLRIPAWVAAARSVSDRFMVTMTLGVIPVAGSGVPAAAAQFSDITCVGSNEANDVPPLLGTIPFTGAGAETGIIETGAAGVPMGVPDPELVMVQAIVGPAVAAPRYLHVHDRTAAIAGLVPLYVFPLGAGVAAVGGGGFGGTFWFPPGLRSNGLGMWQVAVSSAMGTTTAVADCLLQGLVR